MPPKKDKGKAGGKAGRPLKDVLPPNAKPPREGQPVKQPEESVDPPQREYTYKPFPLFPEWPGNQAAKDNDFELPEQGEGESESVQRPVIVPKEQVFHDETPIYLPVSFFDFERREITWRRPQEFLKLAAIENEMHKVREEKKTQFRRKSMAVMNSLRILGTGHSERSGSETPRAEKTFQEDGDSATDISTRMSLLTPEKIAEINIPFDIRVVSYKEREETAEEMKRRKEEQEKQAAADKGAKKKAPAPKKGAEVQEEQPQKIKEVLFNSMDMSLVQPLYSKWTASLLQVMKDRSIRDSVTKEQPWQRIYPQGPDGLPVYNPKGKYWVKLHIFGKERLVEIDDRMPCNYRGQLLLPRSSDQFEIWPMLIVKAILKAYSYKFMRNPEVSGKRISAQSFDSNLEPEVGDGTVIYALTGLLPEYVPLWKAEADGNREQAFFSQSWEQFNSLLSDQHYFKKLTYAVVFCDPDFKPTIPSMKRDASPVKKIDMTTGEAIIETPVDSPVRSPFKESPARQSSVIPEESVSNILEKKVVEQALEVQPQSQARTLGRLKKVAKIALSVTTGKKLEVMQKERPSYVIPGFGYALLDLFENKFVDMKRVVPKEQEEFKSPFSPKKKKLYSQLTREQKNELKRKKLEAKRAAEEEEKQFEETALPKQYKLIKIKSSVANYPVINTVCPFTNQEIRTAKKCLLNQWSQPPMAGEQLGIPLSKGGQFDSPPPSAGFKLSVQVAGEMNEEEEKSEAMEQAKVLEPRTRAPGGIWMQASDFPSCFQHMLVFHNPAKFTNQLVIQDIWENPEQSTYVSDELNTFIDLKAIDETDKTKEEAAPPMTPPGSAYGIRSEFQHVPGPKQNRDYSMVVAFMPYPVSKWHSLPPQPRYSLNPVSPDAIFGDTSTGGLCGAFHKYLEARFLRDVSGAMKEIKEKEKQLTLRGNVFSPMGYVAWVCSNMELKKLNKIQYLTEHLGYKHKQHSIEISPVERGNYHIFFRYDLKIPAGESPIDALFFLSNPDKYLLSYLRFKLYNRNQDSLIENQNIARTECRNYEIYNTPQFRASLEAGGNYVLLLESFVPYTVLPGADPSSNAFTLDIVNSGSSEIVAENIEGLEPIEYTENYIPNNQGVLFREKIYIADKTTATFLLNIQQDGAGGEEGTEAEVGSPERKKLPIYFQIFDHKTLITQVRGDEGQALISHVVFRGSTGLPDPPAPEQMDPTQKVEEQKQEVDPNVEMKHSYVIQARFDLCSFPDCIDKSDENERLRWLLKVYSQDTMAVVKDTEKEDSEKALKASWEQNEPGRAEKAKRSRLKYLAYLKKEKGEQITEEEEEMLREPWFTAKKDEPLDPKAKGKKDAKKGAPDKGKKGGGDAIAQEEQKPEKALPKSTEHTNHHVIEFLQHFEAQRKLEVRTNEQFEPRKRTQQELSTISELHKEDIERERREYEELCKEREVQAQKRKEVRICEVQFRERYNTFLIQSRKLYKRELDPILAKRYEYREMISHRKDKQRNLLNLISEEKKDIAVSLRVIDQAIEKALEEAKEALVPGDALQLGEKTLEQLKYWKSVEDALREAMGEKNGEEMRNRIAQIENENIPVEPKFLNEAKNALAKIK